MKVIEGVEREFNFEEGRIGFGWLVDVRGEVVDLGEIPEGLFLEMITELVVAYTFLRVKNEQAGEHKAD